MGCGASESVSVINAIEEKKLKNQEKKETHLDIEDLNTKQNNISSSNIVSENNVIKSKYEPSKSSNTNTSNLSKLPRLISLNKQETNDFGKERKVNFKTNTDDDDVINYNNNNDDNSNKNSDYESDDGNYDDDEYGKVITEKSDRNLVDKVEQEFVARNLDLFITGKSCPPLLSKKEREIMDKKEETKALEMLKINGLVQVPVAMKQNYATFEIVEEKLLKRTSSSKVNSSNQVTIPPSLLLKREKSPPKLTVRDIEQKLEKANQRKLDKIEKVKLKSVNSSISLEKRQTNNNIKYENSSNEQPQRYNSSDVLERQKRLLEIRDKLKAKDASVTVSTPRSKELVNELENFRPKTSQNFRPDF
jgi:hypothetical protein